MMIIIHPACQLEGKELLGSMAGLRRPNAFVLANCLFVCICAIGAGYFIGSFSGILEMSSFQAHFRNLYSTRHDEDDVVVVRLGLNDSTPGFCGAPDNATSMTCGSGEGVGAASLIGFIVAASQVGSIVGSLLGAWLSDLMSRKYGLMFGSAVFVIGAAVTCAAYHGHEWMLILGRFLSGFAVGLLYAIMPVYLAEVTPKDSRGLLTSLVGPMFGLGLMVGVFANVGWAEFELGWRLSIGLMVIIGLIALVGFKFIPHSPRWLVKKRRDQEALMVLSRINCHSEKEAFVDTYLELENLKESIEMAASSNFFLTVKDFCQWKYIYRFLLTSSLFILKGTGAFCYYYASTVFCEVGVSPFIAAMVVGVVVFAASIVTMIFVDMIGRRLLFLTCISVNFASVLTVAVLTQLCSSPGRIIGYVIVALISIFTFGYSCSWLTLPWVINSEVFPTKIRGLTAGTATSIFSLSTFVTTFFTPLILSSPVDVDGFMYITAGLNLIGFILIFFAVPETKGVTLEEMDELFSKTFWQRLKGNSRCKSTMSLNSVKTAVNVLALQDVHT